MDGTVGPLVAGLLFAAVAIGLGALVVLHVKPTGLSPRDDAVSRYGISNYAIGYRVQTISYGAAGLLAAIGIGVAVAGSVSVVVACCVAFGVARLAISWWPMDEPGTVRTTTGRNHGLLAMIAFVAIAAAALRLPHALHTDHVGGGAASQVFGILMIASLVAMVLTRAGTDAHYFGLVERAFYVFMTAWLLTVAAILFG